MVKPENEFTWRDIEIGAIVTTPGNAIQYRTGDWRSQKPEYIFDRCIKCGVCAIYCPEGCINQNEEGHFVADMYYCKGCGICATECPVYVISMVEEVE
ncbi:MAG: 4Fe-4S binding protein [Dehalococcoidales bacterium]|nr:4Fe-4S binding protein [Dehalococcoidales bacterium]MDD3264597.1 4Fe-4S binding protein [Dehalococcoidales bacterium]MDD4322239.1 4Fe-4S binding protein [Dehalococcoidales bacterium]MDD4793819.1 4Fe-4S binding protein [Dehalococcoidales bacterium]MDD5121931.1 4Fe-4S binding protein [Dehalococcoidales bacterium]